MVTNDVPHDLGALMGRFSDALAVLEVTIRALEGAERGTEACVLRTGLAALAEVYAELDRAISQSNEPVTM